MGMDNEKELLTIKYKNVNARTFLMNAKAGIARFETKLSTEITDLSISTTNVMDKFLEEIAKAEPLVLSAIDSPVTKMILASAGLAKYSEPIIAILNRVAPKLKAIADDKVILDGAIHHIAAEILLLVHGGALGAEQCIDAIQQLFLPAPVEA
jgi:hypothetical protein